MQHGGAWTRSLGADLRTDLRGSRSGTATPAKSSSSAEENLQVVLLAALRATGAPVWPRSARLPTGGWRGAWRCCLQEQSEDTVDRSLWGYINTLKVCVSFILFRFPQFLNYSQLFVLSVFKFVVLVSRGHCFPALSLPEAMRDVWCSK